MARLCPLLIALAVVGCSPSAPAEQPQAPTTVALEAMPVTIGVLEDRPGETSGEPAVKMQR